MPNGIPRQGGGAPGYSQPLVDQLQNIGSPLISKATQTTTQPGSFDPMQLMMMLYMMDVFKKKPPGVEGAGVPGEMGIADILKMLAPMLMKTGGAAQGVTGALGATGGAPGMPF